MNALKSGKGQGGRSPGKQGAGEERAGSRISKMAESGREIQKGKLSLFVTAHHPLKETNPTIVSWLPFNILQGWKQNFVCKKSQETKIRTQDKKKQHLLQVKLETFPSCLHDRSWMRWNDTCASVSTVSVVSVSPVLLKGGSQERKGQKGMGGGKMGYGKREVVSTLSLPPLPLKTVATILLNFIWVASSPSKLETMSCSCNKKYFWNLSSYWKNCTEEFQNWQLCILCDNIFSLYWQADNFKLKYVWTDRPVSDHEMNVSTVHVHTEF